MKVVQNIILAFAMLHLHSTGAVNASAAQQNSKLVWKVKPQPYQLAKEHDSVKLNCEFEYSAAYNASTGGNAGAEKYFVIWYKDGASQNVLSLNDQLARPNSTSYEITGTYNLIIKNLTREHSGLYTCQLFQSLDLVASVNLTVLVAPKYARIHLKETLPGGNEESDNEVDLLSKGYLVEGELVHLECCTNADANPTPNFEWHRMPVTRANLTDLERVSVRLSPNHVHHHSSSLIKNNQELVRRGSGSRLCNRLRVNLTRFDNLYNYKCMISNEALVNRKPIEDTLALTVEYKPDVLVHLASSPLTIGGVKLVANSSLELFCNATARPNALNYQWYFEDSLLRDHRTSTLSLSNVGRGNAGKYECRCSNRHGIASSEFKVEILYAEVKATNRTSFIEQKNLLRDVRAHLVSSYENSSLTLTCQVESNPSNENVMWYYYELSNDGSIRNQVILSTSPSISTWTSQGSSGSENTGSFYSHLVLSNLSSNHSGYYSCSISSLLVDSLNRTQAVNANASYFLLVQYAPIVKVVRRTVYANNYDQVELACEVRSNPQSIFSWYYGNKELFSSYKYNLSSVVYKQMHRTYLDDLENYHHYRSKLVINSLTQFDFGEYICRANNIIGESLQIIKLKRKEKPSMPMDVKATDLTTNSVQLSWLVGSNGGGENTTYVITINNLFNVTSDNSVIYDDNGHDGGENDDDETRLNTIEIRGLHANQEYEFKIMALNSLGFSEFSSPLHVQTLRSHLNSEHLPLVTSAQFNEQREAICFDLDSNENSYESTQYENMHDLLVRIEIDLDESLLRMTALNSSGETSKHKKIYLIESNRLKQGQNCISYSQIIDVDYRGKNESSMSIDGKKATTKNVITLDSGTSMMLTSGELTATTSNTAYSKYSSSVEYFDFHDFIRLHRVNVSLCYTNDSSVCSQKIGVSDYNPDLSAYLTLVAIGCSAILIFLILLIASICCCCCRRRGSKRKNATAGLKNDLNSKLVIKSFPIVTTQQTNYDYSDESTKSSQQHILNTSGNGSSGNHSSGSSSFTEKTFFHTQHQHHHQPTDVFAAYSAQSTGLQLHHHHHHQISSIATVESDASSSTSLENKTASTSQGGNTSSQTHSPYTLTDPGFISFQAQKQGVATAVYTGGNPNNNIYIKTYRQQQQFDGVDNGFSTNKKLVYEVIV